MRLSSGERWFEAFNITLLIILMVITIYPFYYVFNASFSDSQQLLSHSGLILAPLGFSLEAYKLVFDNPNIWSGYQNTLIVAVGGTAINLVLTTLGAYGLSRKQVYWKNKIMVLIIITMFFSGGLIPTYLVVNNTLHLGNSLLALMLPTAVSTWNLIVMRTSFDAIPESLLESARVEGANDFVLLRHVVIPLSMPVISVMILFYGVQHWNSWFSAVIYLRDRGLYPLQLILREILIQNGTDAMASGTGNGEKEAIGESIKYATVMSATLPILLVYPFLQKYFVKGVMVGALKE